MCGNSWEQIPEIKTPGADFLVCFFTVFMSNNEKSFFAHYLGGQIKPTVVTSWGTLT
jgi:hypothetical protein